MPEYTIDYLLPLIARIADRFGRIDGDSLDETVNEALAQIGQATDADRCYLFRFSADSERVTGTHEWTSDGVPGSIEGIVDLECALFPDSLGRLINDGIVAIPRVADVPASMARERAIWQEEGNRSMLAIPVRSKDRTVGTIGLDWVRGDRDWSDNEVELLRIMGTILFGALARREDARVQEQNMDALRAADMRFRSLLTQTRDALFCWEYEPPIPTALPVEEQAELMFQARLVECNDETARSYGAPTAADIRGAVFADIKALTRDDFRELFRDFVRSGYRTSEHAVAETRPDGKVLHYVNSAYGVVENDCLVRTWGSFRDVTELVERRQRERDLEAQLDHAQKMESIGRLAGGVAHDFNNMLLAILGYTDLATQSLAGDPKLVRTYLDQVRIAGERGATLTRQLLAFSRKETVELRAVDPDRLLRDIHGMLRSLLPESIDLEVRGGLDGHCIEADPGLVEQVVLNLCVNARDAMPNGGKLRLFTQLERRPGLDSPARAVLIIEDDGDGMPPDVQARIFEPFFTTKEPGKGTGLGLYVVYGIVQRHGADIAVSSDIGSGTRIEIAFECSPRREDDAGQQVRPVIRGGDEPVLVIEDEEAVRNLIKAVLEGAGYDVRTAADGDAGVQVFERDAAACRLVILDAVLPKRDGMAVWRHISSRRPGLPALFISGYDRDMFPPRFFETRGRRLLAKPFTAAQLLGQVRSLLDDGAFSGTAAVVQDDTHFNQ